MAVSTQNQPAGQTLQYLEELSFLAKTVQIQKSGFFTQNLPHPDAWTYIGKGKLQELQGYVQAYPVEMIIFDDQLSSLQFRSLEKALPDQRILDMGLLRSEVFMNGRPRPAQKSKFNWQGLNTYTRACPATSLHRVSKRMLGNWVKQEKKSWKTPVKQ